MAHSPHPGHETAVFPEDQFGIAQPRGKVTIDVIVDYALALASHPDWRPGFTEVWDVRHALSVDVVPTDIARVLDLERRTKEALAGSSTLIVTYRPLVLYTAQFYATLVKPLGRTVIAVDTATEAAAILGIDGLPELQYDASGD